MKISVCMGVLQAWCGAGLVCSGLMWVCRGRSAVSGFRVLKALGDGAAALVEWQLQTGRTHQIR